MFCAGKRCVEVMQEYYCYPFDEIAFICDNDRRKQGGAIYNVPICPPEKLLESPDGYVVLITVYDDYSLKRIMQQLAGMHISRYYSAAILLFANQINRYYPDGKRRYHELNTYSSIEENKGKIEQVKNMLCDEKSVELYGRYIEKVKYNIKGYWEEADSLYEHYFSDGIFKYSEDEVLVDGGAFDGDDTIWLSTMLRQQGRELKKSYCFEPDSNNFFKACKNLENHFGEEAMLAPDGNMAKSSRFQVFKSGLFDKNCTMGFCEYGTHSSHFTKEGQGGGVPAVRLDDMVEDKVTFIKYDLEGADIPAIKGAEKTIRKYRPKLALSIYHNIEDLWEIPLLIKGYVPEYKLFVRHHTVFLWDKILYAAVEEDLISD